MPTTNRPFFANFFAAFRVRSSPTFQAKSSSTSASTTLTAATAHISSTTTGPTTAALSQPTSRTITTRTTSDYSSQQSTCAAVVSSSSRPAVTSSAFSGPVGSSPHALPHARYPAPLSRSPGTSTPANSHSFSASGGSSTPYAHTRGRQRRGSDSSNSSGGFIDAIGPEKWYIGGRTAGGEERFYRLGLVTAGNNRRIGSADRLSL